MNHCDSDADSKLYYQKTAGKHDFVFFERSISDFGYLSEDIMQIFDTIILMES